MRPTTRYIPKDSIPCTHGNAPGAIVYQYTTPKGLPAAIAYHGKSSKHDWHYAFRNEAARDKRTAEHFQDLAERAVIMATRKAEREQPHGCKVGDIFNFCWGYDQTNQDFYQVVAVTPGTVTIREIATRTHQPDNDMQRWVVPCPGQFKGEPMTKRPYMWNGKPCLRIKSYGSCQLWDGNPVYETSYA